MLATLRVSGPLKQLMKNLARIVALAALAIVVGDVCGAHHAAVDAKSQALPPAWDAEPKRVLARACADCHSSHTDWPWYSHVVPVSWWIEQHVRQGRQSLDFSEWEKYSAQQKHVALESICGVMATRRMPPQPYSFMHPETRLTEKDKNTVCNWVQKETNLAR